MKYFIALLLLAGCTERDIVEPKFHVNDQVVVASGFYAGCIGNVKDYNGGVYTVRLRGECNYVSILMLENRLGGYPYVSSQK